MTAMRLRGSTLVLPDSVQSDRCQTRVSLRIPMIEAG